MLPQNKELIIFFLGMLLTYNTAFARFPFNCYNQSHNGNTDNQSHNSIEKVKYLKKKISDIKLFLWNLAFFQNLWINIPNSSKMAIPSSSSIPWLLSVFLEQSYFQNTFYFWLVHSDMEQPIRSICATLKIHIQFDEFLIYKNYSPFQNWWNYKGERQNSKERN